MINLLPTFTTNVNGYPVRPRYTLIGRYLLSCRYQTPRYLQRCLIKAVYVMFWYDQDVDSLLRVNILKGGKIVVLPDNTIWAVSQFTKQAIW